jgi:hypothetical protein
MSNSYLKITEKNGIVSLTRLQVKVMLMIAQGEPYDGTLRASSAWIVKNKILKATGWEPKRVTAIFCRFVYKHRLLKL